MSAEDGATESDDRKQFGKEIRKLSDELYSKHRIEILYNLEPAGGEPAATAWVSATKFTKGPVDAIRLFKRLNDATPIVPMGYGETLVMEKAPVKVSITFVPGRPGAEVQILSLPFMMFRNLVQAGFDPELDKMKALIITLKATADEIGWGEVTTDSSDSRVGLAGPPSDQPA
jgi:hypothetical protein